MLTIDPDDDKRPFPAVKYINNPVFMSSMGRTGIIGGSAFLDSGLFKNLENKTIRTEYGDVSAKISPELVFIQRHGKNTPPHRIGHRANIQAMKDMGIREIIAISSCGSLKKGIRPGDIVIIDDYMQLSGIPTFFDDRLNFTAPGMSEKIRKRIFSSAEKINQKLRKTGTYYQTSGPRFETPAEVRFISGFADVVGMTIASEATLANEAGIGYAAICSVDNYANSIGKAPDWDEIKKIQKKNAAKVMALVQKTLSMTVE